jgi:hypothetical protein
LFGDAAPLVGDIWHDALAGVGRRGRRDVGDEVEQRRVRLVADGAHHGRAACGDGADQRFVRERQEVLDAAAAAGDDDQVDVGVGVEPAQCVHHVGDRGGSLRRHVLDPERDRGEPAAGVLDDVALGRTGPAGDQADPLRQEGQWTLAVGGEESLGGEQAAQALQLGQQFAQADLPDLGGPQAQRAALDVEVRPGAQHHP